MKKQLTTQSSSTLEQVASKFSEAVKVEGVKRYFKHYVETVLPGGKVYKEESDFEQHIEFRNEDFVFVLNAYNNDTVELYWLENISGKKGIGTNLMNILLDIADELNIKVRLCAVPFAAKKIFSNSDTYKAAIRLYNFYMDFDFVRTPRTPEFIYGA